MISLKDAFRPDVVAAAVRPPEFVVLARRAARRRIRRRFATVASALAVLAVVVPAAWTMGGSSGSAPPVPPAEQDPSFGALASTVAEAYESSGMAFVRQYGFVTAQSLTALTAEDPGKPGTFRVEDTFATQAQYEAFLAGRFSLTPLPLPLPPETATLVRADGSRVQVPIASGPAAQAAMRSRAPVCAEGPD